MAFDKNAYEWIVTRTYCEQRLIELRERNDSSLDASETEHIRGMIAFCKEVMALGDDTKQDIQQTGDSGYTY